MSNNKPTQPARRKVPSGAARSQRSWRHPLRSWLGSHRTSALQALERVRHYPFSSAMTILVMTIALALPMGLMTVGAGLQLSALRGASAPFLVSSGLKLLAFPAMVVGLAWALGLSGLLVQVAVLLAA
mgnify:CR=1 FL=1